MTNTNRISDRQATTEVCLCDSVTADSIIIVTALTLWHAAERGDFERGYPNLIYNSYAPKVAKDGKRWIKLNRGTSGVYLIDKASMNMDVYSIKAYGVPNRKIGTLQSMMSVWMQHSTAASRSTGFNSDTARSDRTGQTPLTSPRRPMPSDRLKPGSCF